MATLPLSTHVTVDEYQQTPAIFERYEFVHGRLVEKSVPTWKHSRLQIWLGALLLRYTRGLAIGSELHGKISETIWRIPDVAVQLESVAENEPYAITPLQLAIEILSPEDNLRDLQAKFREYQAWGVLHCWLFDPEGERAWIVLESGELEEITFRETMDAGEIQLPMREIFSIFHTA